VIVKQNELISCPECKSISTYAEWESGCEYFKVNPESKNWISPFKSAITSRTSNFECPKCHKMILGDRLDRE